MTHVFTQGVGPFSILVKLRAFGEWVGDNLGLLFRCPLCFSTNLGIIFSLFNLFLIPINISPFNIVFDNLHEVWYYSVICCFMDGFATAGACFTIYNLNDLFDKITIHYLSEEEEDAE